MFSGLARLLPLKTADLEAKLHGVAGHTGRGEVEYARWSGGFSTLEAELRGVAGVSADLLINGVLIAEIALSNGRADQHIDTRRTGADIVAKVGDEVEIRQNGVAILQGVFMLD